MEAERWRRLSPLLDALLELEPGARADSLSSLRSEDPQLAEDLEQLLRLEEDSGDFLRDPLVAPLPGLRVGGSIGPYKLERMLGEGGMGQVWLAQRDDGLYQRRVALKLLRPGLADPNLRLRFTRERQILARLEHPHIARLLDAGISSDGQPYLALEYVEGQPITDWCRDKDVPLDQRLHLFQQICRALSHAHANLIVHRDLKPSNILVTPLGEVRLLDFGIAKLLDTPDNLPEHTRTGVRAFTLHYAAPEQLLGEPVTTMTDVYALGMVLYELIADGRPYRLKRQSDAEWEEAILHADPQRPSMLLQRMAEEAKGGEHAQPLRKRARAVAGDLDNIALKALSKQPEQRYASAEALAQDVQRFREGKPVFARPQRLGYRFGKYVRRHRWALLTAVLASVVLSSALGIVAWQARSAMAQANRAQAMQDFVVGLIGQAGSATATGQLDLRLLLDGGLLRVDRELVHQPEARAELYGVIAQLRIGIGDYAQALQLLQRQSRLIAGLENPPPGLRLTAAADTGRAYRLLGHPQDCVSAMQPEAELARDQESRVPLQSAEFLSQLGRCHRALGRSDSAALLFNRSLGLRRSVPDADAAAVENLADLASLRADAGDGDGALRDYTAALRELRTKAGARHPLAIDMERIVCALERNAGRLEQASRHCNTALRLGLELYGMEHRSTIDARRQLAAIRVDQGRYDEAETAFKGSRAWLAARLGDSHPDVARDDNSLGIIAWERGDLQSALASISRAIATLQDAPRPNNLSSMMFNKAMVLQEAGENDQAYALLQQSRRMRVEEVGASHPLIGDTDRLLGEVAASLGKREEALRALQSAVDLTRAGFGATHPHTYRAQLSQARHAVRLDASPAQQAESRQVFDTVARIRGDDNEIGKLRWRACAYAAELGCNHGDPAARAQLRTLLADMHASLPQGGETFREAVAIANHCGVRAATR